jgi:hypothetical protein
MVSLKALVQPQLAADGRLKLTIHTALKCGNFDCNWYYSLMVPARNPEVTGKL